MEHWSFVPERHKYDRKNPMETITTLSSLIVEITKFHTSSTKYSAPFKMKSISKLFLAVAFLLGLVESSKKGSGGGLDRPIQIINESGRRIELYWVHSATDELVKQSDPFVYNGATFNLNSFVGHKFQVREMPGAKSGVCGDESENLGARCRISYFTVNSNYDQSKSFYDDRNDFTL